MSPFDALTAEALASERKEQSARDALLRHCADYTLFSWPYLDIESAACRLRSLNLVDDRKLGPLTVEIVSSFTTSYLVDFLNLMLFRRGFAPTIREAPYGTLITQLMTGPQSSDLVFVLPTHRDLQYMPQIGCTESEADSAVAAEVGFWTDLLKKVDKPVVFLDFCGPRGRPLSERDGTLPGGLLRHIRKTNLSLGASLAANVSLVDGESLQMRVGMKHWHDERLYYICKQPFAMEALPEVADTLASAAAGLLGRGRKALVLDLDNTMWGDTIGEVGSSGIVIGPESAEGEAFAAFQLYLKSLASRGIILSVCSKNDEEVARAPFRSHPNMVLGESDISCFVANYQDKATNIRRIAETLNLGLESLVFVDDNPVERALIASELPEVLVIDLADDPAKYVASLDAAKAFPVVSLTSEDLGRNASYSAIAEIAASSDADLEKFLKGLQPRLVLEEVDGVTVARVSQLFSKTNQFKLNPRLFTEQELLAACPNVLVIRLSDRLQHYGIVAALVTDPRGKSFFIENWVMSCRVFSRRLEYATMQILLDTAGNYGADQIHLRFVPSSKNRTLHALIAELGFAPDGKDGLYALDLRRSNCYPEHFMAIIDERKEIISVPHKVR